MSEAVAELIELTELLDHGGNPTKVHCALSKLLWNAAEYFHDHDCFQQEAALDIAALALEALRTDCDFERNAKATIESVAHLANHMLRPDLTAATRTRLEQIGGAHP